LIFLFVRSRENFNTTHPRALFSANRVLDSASTEPQRRAGAEKENRRKESVILRGCKQSLKNAEKQQFVILNAVKDDKLALLGIFCYFLVLFLQPLGGLRAE